MTSTQSHVILKQTTDGDIVDYLTHGFVSIESIMDRMPADFFENFNQDHADVFYDDDTIDPGSLSDLSYYLSIPLAFDGDEYYVGIKIFTCYSMYCEPASMATQIEFLADSRISELPKNCALAEYTQRYTVLGTVEIPQLFAHAWPQFVDQALDRFRSHGAIMQANLEQIAVHLKSLGTPRYPSKKVIMQDYGEVLNYLPTQLVNCRDAAVNFRTCVLDCIGRDPDVVAFNNQNDLNDMIALALDTEL